MATNCIIGLVKEDGSVEGITCHWDGGPYGVGQTLVYCYGQEETERLIDLGAISTLGDYVEPPAGVEHSFENPHDNVTVAYRRDRGDMLGGWLDGASVKDFLLRAPSTLYTYLYVDGDWYLHVANDPDGLRLAPALMR